MATKSEGNPGGDLFDSVLSLEETLQRQGREKGAEHGGRIGFLEGYGAGRQKGYSAGSEIGFMLGVCESVAALGEQFSVKTRTQKSVQALIDSLKKFPFNDPSEEDYVENFEKLRTKFRQVCAQLKMTQEHKDSLSF